MFYDVSVDLMRKKVVCFTGMDGSGKTSHSLRLMAELRKRGIKCKYTWCRWSPGLADPFHFLVRKTLGYDVAEYKSCAPLRLLYQFLVLLDCSVSIAFKIRLHAMRNDLLLVDRYIYDTLADLYFAHFYISIFFRKLLIMMNPQPNITFLIDVSPQVASLRKNDLQLIEAERYRNIYLCFAKIYNFCTIVNMNFCMAHAQILRRVTEMVDSSK